MDVTLEKALHMHPRVNLRLLWELKGGLHGGYIRGYVIQQGGGSRKVWILQGNDLLLIKLNIREKGRCRMFHNSWF